MRVLDFTGGYLVRLERGEEVTAALEGFLQEEGIQAGVVHGLGGVQNAELGFFDLDSKSYQRKKISGNLELIHFGGNITLVEGVPFIHAHAIVSGPDFAPQAGHFFCATVAITGEFVIHRADWSVRRIQDPFTGLKLMDLPES
jgi:predicted DNA-binding protein with PD1-like motif